MESVESDTGAGSTSGKPDEMSVRMLARHDDLDTETTGDPADVLEDLDAVGLVAIHLAVGSLDGRAVASQRVFWVEPTLFGELPTEDTKEVWFAGISFGRLSGVVLRVRGSQPKWVRSTFNELATELSKGVPKWSWLRAGWMWPVYALSSLLASLWAMEVLRDGRIWLWLALSGLAGVVVGSLLLVGARRFLPGFELLSTDNAGRGVAVLVFIVALVFQFPVGMLVNLATQ